MRRVSCLLTVALLMLLAACGGGEAASSSSSVAPTPSATEASRVPKDATLGPLRTPGAPEAPVEPTPADINFAQMMIGHHEQAITLVDIAKERTTNAELLALADQIAAAQGPEIELMSGWVAGWGYALFDPADHEGHDMPGMLTAAELEAIETAPDADFDRLWLEGMIAHHDGAIVMAQDQLRDGEVPAVRELSEEIITSQQAEIDKMREMITALG